jgi:hypothetical protein
MMADKIHQWLARLFQQASRRLAAQSRMRPPAVAEQQEVPGRRFHSGPALPMWRPVAAG